MLSLFAVVDADDDDSVGDQPRECQENERMNERMCQALVICLFGNIAWPETESEHTIIKKAKPENRLLRISALNIKPVRPSAGSVNGGRQLSMLVPQNLF